MTPQPDHARDQQVPAWLMLLLLIGVLAVGLILMGAIVEQWDFTQLIPTAEGGIE